MIIHQPCELVQEKRIEKIEEEKKQRRSYGDWWEVKSMFNSPAPCLMILTRRMGLVDRRVDRMRCGSQEGADGCGHTKAVNGGLFGQVTQQNEHEDGWEDLSKRIKQHHTPPQKERKNEKKKKKKKEGK
ncbi:MAG: hypothetical protein Q8P67_15670 [archaeon]|nr:hypothetical protein [archaeon]